ncbi:ABC transporter ATP-binding protein [Nocardioides jishulii]|uniref:ABC transporter ATP-binding protein n=1 Tax=Nocardioides jishulii TaxID=2575440 RepID=A0A4U2YND7_9ACTN|nr:ABC transporter ATP-binding protein [Nocardioides jishulii]QCX26817.1 ABC transporter ATP-binding protein [Nocardioides jishulii]TKI61301.1 ABC transporter ATP-binding protein [Nocardioides jishulii]
MAENHTARVELAGVRHHFTVGGAAVGALERVDLTLEPGEFVTLAGPSGCGKTTLLRLVAGFMAPSEGSVSVGDRPVRGPGAERGVVFQQPTLFPWLSVRRNVELGPKLRGVGKAARREVADRYLELVGLEAFGDHRPYELSGGMQQRCQIARVLANESDIVLMDEPFGALDALTRERLQNELLEIWRATGRTILFITHSVDEAVFLGSRVLVMSPRPGRIVLDRSAVFTQGGAADGVKVAPEEIRALPAYRELLEEVRAAIHLPATA